MVLLLNGTRMSKNIMKEYLLLIPYYLNPLICSSINNKLIANEELNILEILKEGVPS
jgi:hypothetical protein